MNKSSQQILKELNEKFNTNLKDCVKNNKEDVEQLFLNLSGISNAGEILKNVAKSKHHHKCCLIIDEVFSDLAVAVYLASIAMDQPAKIIMRRALELV